MSSNGTPVFDLNAIMLFRQQLTQTTHCWGENEWRGSFYPFSLSKRFQTETCVHWNGVCFGLSKLNNKCSCIDIVWSFNWTRSRYRTQVHSGWFAGFAFSIRGTESKHVFFFKHRAINGLEFILKSAPSCTSAPAFCFCAFFFSLIYFLICEPILSYGTKDPAWSQFGRTSCV